jgi:hypothetical protein
MKWVTLPSIDADMRVWGSHRGLFSYVITLDRKIGDAVYSMRYAASAKPLGKNLPFVTERIDLGVYDHFVEAEKACMRHSRRSAQ